MRQQSNDSSITRMQSGIGDHLMPPLNRKKINKSLSRIVDNFDDDEDDPILG